MASISLRCRIIVDSILLHFQIESTNEEGKIYGFYNRNVCLTYLSLPAQSGTAEKLLVDPLNIVA